MFELIYSLNEEILYLLNNLPAGLHLASSIIGWSVYLMIAVVLYQSYREHRWGRVFLCMALPYIASLIIKSLTQIPRPYMSLENLFLIENTNGYSFPSSHTTTAFAASATRDTPFFHIWAALIGLSRIVLAQHYPTDVIAGAFLGFFMSRYLIDLDITTISEKYRQNTFEVHRQLIHGCVGSLVALGIYIADRPTAIFSLSLITVLGYLLSIISRTKRIPVIDWFLDRFERKDDLKKFPGKGAFFFIAGSLISVILYDTDVAFAAVLVLSLGDATTTVGGRLFGKKRHFFNQKKTLEGTFLGILVVYLTVIFFTPLSYFNSLMVAVIFGITESMSLRIGHLQIDDNLLIPIICGLAMTLIA